MRIFSRRVVSQERKLHPAQKVRPALLLTRVAPRVTPNYTQLRTLTHDVASAR